AVADRYVPGSARPRRAVRRRWRGGGHVPPGSARSRAPCAAWPARHRRKRGRGRRHRAGATRGCGRRPGHRPGQPVRGRPGTSWPWPAGRTAARPVHRQAARALSSPPPSAGTNMGSCVGRIFVVWIRAAHQRGHPTPGGPIMSDGYDPTPDHDDYGHYDDPSHDDHGASIHDVHHDHTLTVAYGHGTETLIDHDGDGYVDEVDIDVDGNGHVDGVLTHTVGGGHVLDTLAVDTTGDGKADLIEYDRNHDGQPDEIDADRNGDGKVDLIVDDDDFNG